MSLITIPFYTSGAGAGEKEGGSREEGRVRGQQALMDGLGDAK